MKSDMIKKDNQGKVNLLIEGIMEVLRDTLKTIGDEIELTDNNYGFTTAWLEDDQVWWDKSSEGVFYDQHIDELTELCALYDTILKTLEEIEDEEN